MSYMSNSSRGMDSDRASSPESSIARERVTIANDSLRTAQAAHALAIVVIPLLGLIAAVVLAFQHGIGAIEIGLLLSMYLLTITGITVGFHRLFSHNSFAAHTAVRVALAILGSMAAQGSLTYWVSNHRRHHQYTEQPGDPHSPYCDGKTRLGHLRGFWHSHMGWTFNHEITNTTVFAQDLIRDPVMSKINRLYYLWVLLGLVIPTVLGGLLIGTWAGAVSGFLWGGLVRLFFSYHAVNGIDSITHLYGTRPFESHDQSVNNVLWGIIVLGEGWHNNHHTFPNSAMIGLEWWQIDIGGWSIRALEKLGLVWDVKVPSRSMMNAKLLPN